MKPASIAGAIALIGVGFALAGPRDGDAAARAENVTLGLRDFRSANGVRVHVFTGVVSSPEPRQDVEIVGQDCGLSGYRLISAAQTTAGGAFQAENPQQSPPWASTPYSSGITFRARWNGHLSNPIQYRLPAYPYAIKVPGRAAWKVHFGPQELRVPLAGKVVELQRFSGGRWARIQTARLELRPSLRWGPFNHEAVFTAPRRGLKLRGFLPGRSAAPCYSAGATEPWRS